MSVQRNLFLDEIGKSFHKQRPKVPEGFNTTIYSEQDGDKTFVDIYVRSRGCHHNYLGGCTMCDYWASDEFDSSQMAEFGRDALDSLKLSPTLLVFGPSGSMFDEWEVPAEVRRSFYRNLQSANASVYALFSRVETITEDKLGEVADILDPAKVSIEMGLETADPWKLKYCINKAIDINQIADAFKLIGRFGFSSAVYILVGVPFLDAREIVADTISSIEWAFNRGVDYCVVFPMHIKSWTVVNWLYQHNSYEPVPLWALVDVLSHFTPSELEKIGICWHRPRTLQAHPLYKTSSIPPTTCPICYEDVVRILDAYRFSKDRAKTISMLTNIDCTCKELWRKRLLLRNSVPLVERVKENYKLLGIDVLGADWWEHHDNEVLSSITAHCQV